MIKKFLHKIINKNNQLYYHFHLYTELLSFTYRLQFFIIRTNLRITRSHDVCTYILLLINYIFYSIFFILYFYLSFILFIGYNLLPADKKTFVSDQQNDVSMFEIFMNKNVSKLYSTVLNNCTRLSSNKCISFD